MGPTVRSRAASWLFALAPVALAPLTMAPVVATMVAGGCLLESAPSEAQPERVITVREREPGAPTSSEAGDRPRDTRRGRAAAGGPGESAGGPSPATRSTDTLSP